MEAEATADQKAIAQHCCGPIDDALVELINSKIASILPAGMEVADTYQFSFRVNTDNHYIYVHVECDYREEDDPNDGPLNHRVVKVKMAQYPVDNHVGEGINLDLGV